MRGTAEAITSNDADISQATYDVTPAHKETSTEAFKERLQKHSDKHTVV